MPSWTHHSSLLKLRRYVLVMHNLVELCSSDSLKSKRTGCECLTSFWVPQTNAEGAFRTFTRLFSKQYTDEEEYNTRLNIFKSNVAYITAGNSAGESYQARICALALS